MKQLTPYAELDKVLITYARKLREVLGNNFVGFYLQGSLAIGDFDLTSDIDFIVVTQKDLSKEQVKKVQKVHLATYHQDNRWVKRFEYSFFPKYLLNRFSSPFVDGRQNNVNERKLWYFNNGSKKIEKSDHCNTLVTRWTVREKGITLIGPNPKTLIKPIEPNLLRSEIKDTMIGWWRELSKSPEKYKNRFYQSYLVLNYARMLQDLYEGRISSKREGVLWARLNLNSRWFGLIDFCWQERGDSSISINQPASSETFKKSLGFVEYTVRLAQKYVVN